MISGLTSESASAIAAVEVEHHHPQGDAECGAVIPIPGAACMVSSRSPASSRSECVKGGQQAARRVQAAGRDKRMMGRNGHDRLVMRGERRPGNSGCFPPPRAASRNN